jgi:hypothetical protein
MGGVQQAVSNDSRQSISGDVHYSIFASQAPVVKDNTTHTPILMPNDTGVMPKQKTLVPG